MIERPLGRRVPTDDLHIRKYGLTAEVMPSKPTPVVFGCSWYEAFDRPEFDGRLWWVGRGDLGRVRGGHCVCLKPSSLVDLGSWWEFYDQLSEGKCVGEGASRGQSLTNRKRYDARWLWDRAKERDEWPETNPGDDNGTSVRAAMDVLRTEGHRVVRNGISMPPDRAEGILANRWATSVSEVLACLQSPRYEKIGGVPLLNSWGRSFPHLTYLPLEVLDRLLREEGEATIIYDYPDETGRR